MLKKLSVLLLSAALLLCLTSFVRADFSSPSKNLSNSPSFASKFPKIDRVDNTTNVFAIWVETDGTEDILYFSKSINAGTTWSAPYALTTNGQILTQDDLTDDYAFSFVVADPYVHVVIQWRQDDTDDYDIWYIQSADLGDTWDIWKALTTNDYESRFPDIDARGTYVHVAYQDDWPGNDAIFYKRITNYGAGAVDQTRRLTYSSTDAYYPRIAVTTSGYTVNIVYEDEYSGQYNIFYKHIDDYGAGAFETRRITSNATYWNGRPDVTVGWNTYEPDVYIVYETDYTYGTMYHDIIYKRLDSWGHAGGTIYTARLSYSTTDSRSPYIDYDNVYDSVQICYHDDWSGNNDVMYRKFLNGGGAGFTGQRVSWGTGDSAHATLAAHGQWAWVVWSDNSSGNYEIYLKDGY